MAHQKKTLDGFSENQLKELREIFTSFDKDGDGTIPSKDLILVLRSYHMNPTENEIKEMLKVADRDGNGKIEFEEFADLVKMRLSAVNETEELMQAFKVFDKDGNGYLDEDELLELFPNEDIEKVMKMVDTDGDGKIDYREFVSMITGN